MSGDALKTAIALPLLRVCSVWALSWADAHIWGTSRYEFVYRGDLLATVDLRRHSLPHFCNVFFIIIELFCCTYFAHVGEIRRPVYIDTIQLVLCCCQEAFSSVRCLCSVVTTPFYGKRNKNADTEGSLSTSSDSERSLALNTRRHFVYSSRARLLLQY